MTFNIHDFKANGLQFGGARPSMFEVVITPPAALDLPGLQTNRMTFLIKAASIPPVQLESVDVFYFGRAVKYNGDRTFPDWDITVLNDEDYVIRRALENWANQINTHVTNWQTADAFNNIGYKASARVTQYGKAGNALAAYEFEGLWPKVVEPMGLDWAQQNTIQEFNATFAYDLWTPAVPDGGDDNGAIPIAEIFDPEA